MVTILSVQVRQQTCHLTLYPGHDKIRLYHRRTASPYGAPTLDNYRAGSGQGWKWSIPIPRAGTRTAPGAPQRGRGVARDGDSPSRRLDTLRVLEWLHKQLPRQCSDPRRSVDSSNLPVTCLAG